MPISEKQSRELADSKEIHNLVNINSDTISIKDKFFLQIKENTRSLQSDCVQIQEVQKLLVKYIKLTFNLNQRSEHEQQPLSQDMEPININIKYLEERMVKSNVLEIWSLQISSSQLHASYFGLYKQTVSIMLSWLAMLKKNKRAVTSYRISLKTRNL